MTLQLVRDQVPRPRNRKRGHRESHSGTLSTVVSSEEAKDWSAREEQLRLEELRETQESLFQSFWGWASYSSRQAGA
jgi:hypothetical protein